MLLRHEREQFEKMRNRLAPAFQAIVDIEADEKELTPRERRCLNLLLDGHSNDEIARRMGGTTRAVKHYIETIFAKFEVASRSAIAAKLFRRPS